MTPILFMWALEVAVDIRMAQPDDGRWRNKADAIADGRKDRRHVVIRRTMAVSSTGISVDKNERSEREQTTDERTTESEDRKRRAGLIYLFGGLARSSANPRQIRAILILQASLDPPRAGARAGPLTLRQGMAP